MLKLKTRVPYFVVCSFLCTLSTASALTVSSSTSQVPTVGSCAVFPADNVWNVPVDQLPVHPYSATWVGTIGSATGLHPDFGSDPTNGIPFITVPGTQTKYPATFQYGEDSDPGPYALPLNTPVEGGSAGTGDRHAIAIDTDNCILYEMWAAYPQASSWSAGSGAIFKLTSDALRTSGFTSADAAGLPVFAGLIRYDEILSGHINHALRFTVPHTQNTFVWPARHQASNLTGYQYPPMGARFRLRADFDISGFSPANQVILTALKKYGMILADNGSSWYLSGATDPRWSDDDLHKLTTITGSNFEAIDESGLMVNPDSGQTNISGPTITVSLNPSSASVIAGGTAQFAATVANTTTQTVTWSVNGVTGGNATVGTISSNGLYTAPATVPSGGTGTITATSTDNTSASASGTITITAPAPVTPVLNSISPSSGTQGTNVTVTLTGSNFQSGASVSLGGSGVSVASVTVVNASQIQAVLSIGSAAATGAHGIAVTTSAGSTAAQSFTVNASAPVVQAPVLSSLSPSGATEGTSVTATLNGANFQPGAVVSVGGSGVTVSTVNVVSASQIQAVLSIGSAADIGAHGIAVTQSAGTTSAMSFMVNAPAAPMSSKPTLTSISPNSVLRGTTTTVTLTGTGFNSGAMIGVHGTRISVSNIVVVNPTTITMQVVVPKNAPRQTATITVSASGGTSNGFSFNVQ